MEPVETPHVEVTERGVGVRVESEADAAAALLELRAAKKRFALAKRALNERQRALRAEYTDDVRHRWPLPARGTNLLSLTVRASRYKRRKQLAEALAPLEQEKQRVEQVLQSIEAMRLRLESMKGRFPEPGREMLGPDRERVHRRAQPPHVAGPQHPSGDEGDARPASAQQVPAGGTPSPISSWRSGGAPPAPSTAPARPPLARWRAALAVVGGAATGLIVAGLTFPGPRPIRPGDLTAFLCEWGAIAVLLTYLFRHSLERKLARRRSG